MPGLGLASSFYSPCRRWHAAEHIDSDDLLFGVALNGGCVLHQRDREAVIGGRGEAVLASAAHPVDVVIGTTSRNFSLRLPRAILEARIADLDACNARRIPSNVGGLSLLIGYVGALRLSELTNPADRDLVVSHVYDLVALLFGAKRDARHLAQQGGTRAARLAAIIALLRDPHWHHRKISDIAAEAGFVDLSYFNRTFRRHFGATPSDVRNSAGYLAQRP